MRTILAIVLLLAVEATSSRAEAEQYVVSYGSPAALGGEAWRMRVERARMRYEAYAARAYEDFLNRSGALARRGSLKPGAERALEPILRDPTLRKDDLYVAEDGVMVFHGRVGALHEAADFSKIPPERAEALSLKIDVRMK